MKRLTAHELQAMMRRGDDVHVVDVLPRESFEKHHLPGSINVPLETEGFADEVRRRTGEDASVVVYCASESCDASPKAARQLEQAGFGEVYDFEAGIEGWREAGFALEGAEVGNRE